MGRGGPPRVCHYSLNAFVAATLAPGCAVCRAPLDAPLGGPVCDGCWAAARARLKPHLVLPSVGALDGGAAAAPYEGTVREIIHAFKYEGRRSLADPLAAWMRAAGADVLADTDCVVPVPMHAWRRLHRGFNHARDLASRLDRPAIDALWRVRLTVVQKDLTAAERRRNVRGAFRLVPWLSRRAAQRYVRGRTIVLVDDVATTGATLQACAAALKDAGAGEVRALTVAFTPLTGPARRR